MAQFVGDEFRYAVYDPDILTILVQKLEYSGIFKGLIQYKDDILPVQRL